MDHYTAAGRLDTHADCGAYREEVADGLARRHYHGSQCLSDLFQPEPRLLGLTSSPARVREPAGKGCAERFLRTLQELLFWAEPFAPVETLRQAWRAFRDPIRRPGADRLS